MQQDEVERQIDQMVRFIRQEAEEKANEISVSAEEEFNIEKLQLLEAEKAKIRREYERREGQIETKKKIESSKQLNESRIKVLQAREQAVQQLVAEAEQSLAKIAGDKGRYKQLLVDLLVQAMVKLQEPAVKVKGREADMSLLKDAVEEARKSFKQRYSIDAPNAALDDQNFLPPAPSSNSQGQDQAQGCCGGVVVTSLDGCIVCSNTLDERLKIAYNQNLPAVREQLFGAAELVRA